MSTDIRTNKKTTPAQKQNRNDRRHRDIKREGVAIQLKNANKDGVDHIRISQSAETNVGRALSRHFIYPFSIYGMGSFNSALCFAKWMCSGGDEYFRTDDRNKSVKCSRDEFNTYVLYAKYFQIAEYYAKADKKEFDLISELPCFSYRVFESTGVRELDTWFGYANAVTRIAQHIHEHGLGVAYEYPDRVIDMITKGLAKLTGNTGNEDYAPIVPNSYYVDKTVSTEDDEVIDEEVGVARLASVPLYDAIVDDEETVETAESHQRYDVIVDDRKDAIEYHSV